MWIPVGYWAAALRFAVLMSVHRIYVEQQTEDVRPWGELCHAVFNGRMVRCGAAGAGTTTLPTRNLMRWDVFDDFFRSATGEI